LRAPETGVSDLRGETLRVRRGSVWRRGIRVVRAVVARRSVILVPLLCRRLLFLVRRALVGSRGRARAGGCGDLRYLHSRPRRPGRSGRAGGRPRQHHATDEPTRRQCSCDGNRKNASPKRSHDPASRCRSSSIVHNQSGRRL